ncbi:MAG: tRNA lysidine(34) synthetase TilS [Bacteroidetes bacterium]|nr:tRNA lysidine(34) synthetase TilS [Bacteroidota bacterium]
MEELLSRFEKNWQQQGFAAFSAPFLLAMSGGIDSMVLGDLLTKAGVKFSVAHCNFSLRGAASDGDAQFVQDWSLQRNLHFHLKVFDTATFAVQQKLSTQVAARNLRYDWFWELCAREKYAGVITAHHADDVAETVLMNLCKGTGIAGLHGIRPRMGPVFRPLLFADKKEIWSYAASNDITWREDASNAKTDYLRNAFRHSVLTKIDELLPGAARQISLTAQRIAEAEIIYQSALQRILTKLTLQRGKDIYVPLKLLLKQPSKNLLAYEIFSGYGFSSGQIQEVLSLAERGSGSMVCSASHRVLRHRDFLVVTTKANTEADLVLVDQLPAKIECSVGVFDFSIVPKGDKINDGQLEASIDADRIQLPLLLRSRKEGDYFYPLGMGMKKKKLKKFLIDQKLGVHEKESVRVLEFDRKILWVAGHRLDERFKVTETTQRILKIRFTPNY